MRGENSVKSSTEQFIIKSAKKFEHVNLHNNILNFRYLLSTPQKNIKNITQISHGINKNKTVFFREPFKGYISMVPSLRFVIKDKDGIFTLEIERKMKSGYKVLLEKRLKINVLSGINKYAGYLKNIENNMFLEKEYNEFVDNISSQKYE